MVSDTSVLTALIQTCFWSIINNLGRANRWIQLLVTISNKLKGIKSILSFSGTPHFQIHSILPKIIISLVNQGLFKLCVSDGFAVSISSIKSSKSCVRKWDWKDERHLLAFLCVAGTYNGHGLDSATLSPRLAAPLTGGVSRQAGFASASVGEEAWAKGAAHSHSSCF